MSHVVTRGVGSKLVVSRGLRRGSALLLPAAGTIVSRGVGTRSAVCRGLRIAANGPAPTLRRAVAAALGAAPAVAAIVGTKVYPLRPPESRPTPWVFYQVVSNARGHNLSGPDGVSRARVRLTAASKAYGDCDSLADAFRLLLDGFRGSLGGQVAVIETLLVDENDREEARADGTDDVTYFTTQDYVIRYREAPDPSNVR